MTRAHRFAAVVATALHDTGAHVKQCHATAWDVVFRNGTDFSAHVQLEHEWLRLDTPLPGAQGDTQPFWSLLKRNACLPPGIKLAVAVGDAVAPPVRLCGEVILDDAAEPSVRWRALCAAMQRIVDDWSGLAHPPAVENETHTAAEAADLCRNAGWPVLERDGHTLVELDVPDGFMQAGVVAEAEGGITITAAIGDGAPPTEASEALALLLLRASGSVRLVRAAADERARLEVALSPPVSPTALSHALCALSVAYRLVGREAAALAHDAAIAATYLRLWAAQHTSSNTQP